MSRSILFLLRSYERGVLYRNGNGHYRGSFGAIILILCERLTGRRSQSCHNLGSLFLLKFVFPSSLLLIVIDIAGLTLAFSVTRSLSCVSAFRGHGTSTVLMVTVIAHAHSIQRKVHMRARRDETLLASDFSSRRLRTGLAWGACRVT